VCGTVRSVFPRKRRGFRARKLLFNEKANPSVDGCIFVGVDDELKSG